MPYNFLRVWGIYSFATENVVYTSPNRSDCVKVLNLLNPAVRQCGGYEVVRFDIAECYKKENH